MGYEQFTNEDIVLLLIKKATQYQGTDQRGIRGKKALQKSLYFLNQRNPLFNFRWADYGPFCGEIQQIAEDLIEGGSVEVSEIPTKKKGAVIKNMTFSGERSSEIDIPSEIEDDMDSIVKFVAGKSPRRLELLASVHFWALKQLVVSDGYSSEYVFEKLMDLKPDAGFTRSDVKQAIETLEMHEYLDKASVLA